MEELQSLGVLEIDAAELDPELKTMDTMNARLIFEKNASLCDQAIEILDEFSKEKGSMLASLAGKPLIGRKQEEEAIRDQEEILRTAREIQGYRKKLTENSAAVVKIEQQEAALAPWLDLDIPMNSQGTAKTAVLVGSIDGNVTLDQVYSQLAVDAPQLEAFDIQEISNDAGKLSLVVVCLKTQAQEMEEALRMQGFARPAQLVSEVPAQELENLKNEVVRIQEESEQIREQIRDLHDRKNSLQLVSDYFRIRAQKYEVLGQLRQSESTFFVTGYLPKKQVPAMEKRLTEKYDIVFEAEDADGENVPVALQNSRFGAAGEGVLAAFGLPGKGGDRSVHHYDSLLCIPFRTDVIRCGLRADRVCGLSGSASEIPQNGKRNAEIHPAVHVLWTVHFVLGRNVWRIFRRFYRCILKSISA